MRKLPRVSFIVPLQGKCPACGSPLCTSDRPDRPEEATERAAIRCVGMGHGCPDPYAATKVLLLDHRHVADYRNDGVSIEHPVTCRLDGKSLHDCAVWEAVRSDDDVIAVTRGRYYVELGEDGLPSLTPEAPKDPSIGHVTCVRCRAVDPIGPCLATPTGEHLTLPGTPIPVAEWAAAQEAKRQPEEGSDG